MVNPRAARGCSGAALAAGPGKCQLPSDRSKRGAAGAAVTREPYLNREVKPYFRICGLSYVWVRESIELLRLRVAFRRVGGHDPRPSPDPTHRRAGAQLRFTHTVLKTLPWARGFNDGGPAGVCHATPHVWRGSLSLLACPANHAQLCAENKTARAAYRLARPSTAHNPHSPASSSDSEGFQALPFRPYRADSEPKTEPG